MSPTKGLTGRDASLHAMMPWGSHVAVLSMPRPNRVRPRAVTARYLGAAAKFGPRAIHYSADLNIGGSGVAHTSTFRFLALPHEKLDEAM